MAGVLLLLGLLCACSRREVAGAVTDEPRDMTRGYDIEKTVNVYSWADYIAPDTVSNFEKETGIKVRYDIYDNNEILETKLLSGHSNYDVVVPTDVFFDRQREAGVYRKLDKQALPNLVNADPQIMRAGSRPNELVRIRYDSRENLIALGIIPRPGATPADPNPFPGSPLAHFVADPPPCSRGQVRQCVHD